MNYIKAAEAAVDKARKELEQIGEHYRDNVLVPLCRKLGLTFIAGMGSTTFYVDDNPNDNISTGPDAEDRGYPELVEVFEVLNADGIGQNDCLGYYIAEIKASDIEGKPKRRRRQRA